MQKNTKLTIIILSAVFAVMLAFNFLTPLVSDDFAHYYGMTGEHCDTISQIVSDLKLFRHETNGRVFPHFFVYLFLALPKAVFNIVNALFTACLAFSLGRYFEWKPILLLTVIGAIWIFMPDFGQVFLWLTGATNYLWGLILFSLFIFPFYKRYVSGEKMTNMASLTILGLAAGAWSENGATATLFACSIFGLLIWIREKKLPLDLFIPFVACIAGYAFLMTAPATLETRAGGDIMQNIWFIRVCLKDFCLWLFVIYFVLLVLALFTHVSKKTIIATLVLVSAGLISIAVFAFAVYLPPRSFYVIVTFLVLSCTLLANEIRIKPLIPVIAATTFAVFVWKFYGGTADIIELHRQSQLRDREISQAVDSPVYIERYKTKTKYSAIYIEELSEDECFWYNDLVAKYYGVESIKAK